MCNIYSLVYEYRRGNEEKFLDLIDKFDPLLSKLQRNSQYEDMKNDLILFLLNLINKISLENFKEDKYIISYISKSLTNQYIYINKKYQLEFNLKLYLNEDIINNESYKDFDNIIFKDRVKVLTEKEREVILKIYFYGFTEAQIGREKNISRQAIHKTHVRALNKLKK